jgi:hypothetical protein
MNEDEEEWELRLAKLWEQVESLPEEALVACVECTG